MIHELKCWPRYFEAIVDGWKTFECRKNDRNFRVGDKLILKEYNPLTKSYTGGEFLVLVTYLLEGQEFGIIPGYCVMGIKKER